MLGCLRSQFTAAIIEKQVVITKRSTVLWMVQVFSGRVNLTRETPGTRSIATWLFIFQNYSKGFIN